MWKASFTPNCLPEKGHMPDVVCFLAYQQHQSKWLSFCAVSWYIAEAQDNSSEGTVIACQQCASAPHTMQAKPISKDAESPWLSAVGIQFFCVCGLKNQRLPANQGPKFIQLHFDYASAQEIARKVQMTIIKNRVPLLLSQGRTMGMEHAYTQSLMSSGLCPKGGVASRGVIKTHLKCESA